MNPRRSATLTAALYPTVVIAGWAFVSLAGHGSPRIDISAAAQVVDRIAPSLAANVELANLPRPAAMSFAAAGITDTATAVAFMAQPLPDMTAVADEAEPVTTAAVSPQPVTPASDAQPIVTAADEPKPIVLAALSDPAEILAPEIAQASAASAADAPLQETATPAARIELIGECQVAEACIDQFLWALYQRTPKEDTIKERELRKVQLKRKGKLVTVTRSFTKLVENDFTWKDPHAAERTGMSMMDYVIGGMDRSFKLKLFRTLYAAEAAGLRPGITSAFRDDYRQSIASGLKAASNRSFHGGSLRGGYGHGLAADIVSVNGGSRNTRWASTEALWKWVDANGRQYGIGRPYLKFDPPHVGPIDGSEYVSRRGSAKTTVADVKKRHQHVAHAKPAAAKRTVVARASSTKPSRVAEAR